ncbi:WD40 domain-containing protein [Histoplasma capsulatum H143]|uniref:WD40 domain-containing protein n=1 Tax=Ajellomyces capsulatus (strain H143) TaxID=544712 RepID=C6HNU6_AJECH|nr:WD40 domain-containing protein [Histoplasma capsulatum H143]
MNLALIDPFVLAQDYPDALTGKLRCGHATCLRFNRKGDYLASGRVDGTIVIFDVETNGVARKLRGHSKQIQSLRFAFSVQCKYVHLEYVESLRLTSISWSRCGRYLLSSSQDWKCVLWDMKDGSRVRTVRFEAPVYIAELHPFNHWLFVASLFEKQPVLVDISAPRPVKRILPSAPLRPQLEDTDPAVAAKQAAQDAKHSTCVTIFTALGNHIISGTSKGWINIIETQTCTTIHSTRLCNGVLEMDATSSLTVQTVSFAQ